VEGTQVILEWLAANVRGRDKSGSWDEMRSAARMIGSALRTATRLHKTIAAYVIFEFFAANLEFRRSTGRFFEEDLVNDCMRYGNVNLIYAAINYERTETFDAKILSKPATFNISAFKEEYLFKFGHPCALQALIKHKLFDPNHCHQLDTPLRYALSKRNYKMARMLIKSGAEVDAVSGKNGFDTATCHAAVNGHWKDLKFLLKHGAAPLHCGPQTRTPVWLADHCQHNKCKFLLDKVTKHGKDYLERADLWILYEEEREHWYLDDFPW
jgi:hypothetical protein